MDYHYHLNKRVDLQGVITIYSQYWQILGELILVALTIVVISMLEIASSCHWSNGSSVGKRLDFRLLHITHCLFSGDAFTLTATPLQIRN